MANELIELGDGWHMQESPIGYYLLKDGAYLLYQNGERVLLPTKAEVMAFIAELRDGTPGR